MSLDAFDSHLPVRNQEDPNLLKGTFQGFGTAGNPSGGVVTIQGTLADHLSPSSASTM